MQRTPFRYDPAHAALVLIDVQNDFCHPRGSLTKAGNDVSAAIAMVPRLVELVECARNARVPVIFVRTHHDETNDSPQWLARRSAGPDALGPALTCRTGTWGADFYQVEPLPGETVITKHRYSAFVGTSLDLILRTRGIRSLLFAGVVTEICVESSVRDGLFAEYYVSMIDDCTASYSAARHTASIDVIGEHFGTIIGSDRLIEVWNSTSITVANDRTG